MMLRIRTLFVLLLLVTGLMAAGCALRQSVHGSEVSHLLHDSEFPQSRGYVLEKSDEVFGLSTQNKERIDKRLLYHPNFRTNSRFLANIVTELVADFTYSSSANTAASRTFEDQSANCLSMTILAYAIAEHLGFEARFQIVNIPEYWEWRDRSSLLVRHVNLVLQVPEIFGALSYSHPIEVDFFAPGSSHRYGSRIISKNTVLAMFYNNRGAEAMLAGNRDLAYAYLRAALMKDPQLDMALSNLALLYSREGKLMWAESAYQAALAVNPDSTASAAGLAMVLRQSGRHEAADAIMERIEDRRENNPYYHYTQGEEAYAAGRWEQAIREFTRSIELRPDIALPYFGLAKVYFRLGDHEKTKSYLRRAERYSDRKEAKERYRSKLSLISSL